LQAIAMTQLDPQGLRRGALGRYPSAVYDRPAVRLAVGGTPVGATWLFRSARPLVNAATRGGRPTPSRQIASGAARIAARRPGPTGCAGSAASTVAAKSSKSATSAAPAAPATGMACGP
jgi:hypothetical protein